MHRRAFLKTALVGAGTVGAEGCAHLGGGLLVGHEEIVALVKQLEAGLAHVGSPGAKASFTAGLPLAHAAHDEQVFRDASRTLLLAGAFHSMTEETRAHPAVQQLMRSNLGAMGGATQQLHDIALATTPDQRRELTNRLREDPAALDGVAERMDAEAVSMGVSLEQRTRLRALFHQVGNRMKQSAPLALQEYGQKVAKLKARLAEPRDFERELIARMGERAFWDFEARQRGFTEAWTRQAPAAIVDASPSAPRRDPDRGIATLTSGGVMMGIGLLIGGGGMLVVASGSIAGAFIATAGGLLFLAGLITLIVGLAQRAG